MHLVLISEHGPANTPSKISDKSQSGCLVQIIGIITYLYGVKSV